MFGACLYWGDIYGRPYRKNLRFLTTDLPIEFNVWTSFNTAGNTVLRSWTNSWKWQGCHFRANISSIPKSVLLSTKLSASDKCCSMLSPPSNIHQLFLDSMIIFNFFFQRSNIEYWKIEHRFIPTFFLKLRIILPNWQNGLNIVGFADNWSPSVRNWFADQSLALVTWASIAESITSEYSSTPTLRTEPKTFLEVGHVQAPMECRRWISKLIPNQNVCNHCN